MSSKINLITSGTCKVDKRLNRWKKIEKTENQLKKKKHFRLFNLPHLAFVEVNKQMSHIEQIKLSLVTKKTNRYVKLVRVKTKTCTLIVADLDTKIALNGIDTIICNSWLGPHENLGLLNIRDLIPYSNRSDIVENACFGVQYLQNIFIWKSLEIEFRLADMENAYTGEELKAVVSLNFDNITLRGGNMNKTGLDLIMKTAVCKWKRIDRSIKIIGTQLPLDYYHKNAFKFFNIHYDDACWIRPDYLYSLRNRNEVTLGKNKLTPDDFHAFVMYWCNCRHDMFKVMTMNTNITLSSENLFSGIVFLKTFRSGQTYCLISSHGSLLERKQRLLVVQINPARVLFTACDEQESISISVNGKQQNVSFEYEFWAIQNLKRRNVRKIQLNNVEKKLENVTSDQTIRDLEMKKSELEKEVKVINEHLFRKYKLYYCVKNIATMDEVLIP